MFSLDDVGIPVFAAPMAGGPSTPELVTAMADAGATGYVPGAATTPDELAADIATVRAHSRAPFGVNLFMPAYDLDTSPAMAAELEAYRGSLLPDAKRYGCELPEAELVDSGQFEDKIALLLADPVPFVSFIFGCPDADTIRNLQQAGSYVIVTVTDAEEAEMSTARGANALVVQGPDAGGHRGTHTIDKTPGARPLLPLLREVASVTGLPLIAAGGLMTGSQVREVLQSGASAVQLGTAFLRTPESGAPDTYKGALTSGVYSETQSTRAFSGRFARGLHNRFMRDHHDDAPMAFPVLNELTGPIRNAARAAGDPDGMSLWAGTGFREAMDRPAGEVVASIWRDAQR